MGKNYIGLRFGRLLVTSLGGWYYSPRGLRSRKYKCRCDCGTVVQITRSNLMNGKTNSCGCLQSEMITARNFKHGHKVRSGMSPEYSSWRSMIDRCTNPKQKSWKFYGARGISIYKTWLTDFKSFLDHIGPRPSLKHTLDRYPDKNGNYQPGNVRWATYIQQANNRRPRTPSRK